MLVPAIMRAPAALNARGHGASSTTPAPVVDTLTVNGTTVAPMLAYRGQNATSTTWTANAGPNLSIAGSGTDPTLGIVTPASSPTLRGVQFAAGKCFAAANNGGNIGTDDFVIETYYKNASTVGSMFGNKQSNTLGVGTGWHLQMTTATNYRNVCRTTAGTAIFAGAYGVTANAWSHVVLFIDRSDSAGAKVYVNGAFIGSADPSAAVAGLIDGGGNFTIGALSGETVPVDATIAIVNVWKAPGWFAGGATNTTQFLAAAAARFAAL